MLYEELSVLRNITKGTKYAEKASGFTSSKVSYFAIEKKKKTVLTFRAFCSSEVLRACAVILTIL